MEDYYSHENIENRKNAGKAYNNETGIALLKWAFVLVIIALIIENWL